MELETNKQVKEAIRTKYAWPGGYPTFLVMADNEVICMDCARKEYRRICEARRDKSPWDREWTPVAWEINYEDDTLYCAHCYDLIECAYCE